jgi:hypothetical protein
MMLFQSDQPILGEFSEIETGHLNPKFAWDTSQLLTTSELGFTGPDISRIAYTQFAEPALDDISYHPTRDAKELGFITYYETNEGAWPGIGVNEFTGERTLSYQSVTSETAFDRVPLVEYAMAAVDIELSVSDTGFEDNDPDYIQFYLFRDDETTPTLYYYYDLINGELPLEKTSVSINIPTDWSSVTLQVGTRTNSTSGAERINLHSVSFVGYGYDDAMYVAGDFAVDGDLTSADLNKLQVAIDRSTYVAAMDLDADGRMGINDRLRWIETTWGSYVGDSNWDGQFSSSDLVSVFQAGEYEDDLVANSRWETGDWNGDREFNSSDLVTAFQRGGYEQGSRTAAMAVPEPSYSWLVVVPLALAWRRDLV